MDAKRVLLVHNYYGSDSPSGENRVFELERDLLRSHGHEVATFVRHSDQIRQLGATGLVLGGLTTAWNFRAAAAFRTVLKRFRPDVVHAHNTFPLISPAIFPAANGTARVLTLHNYRVLCAAGIPMRDGAPCTDCIDEQSVRPALSHGCYRGSRVATVPLAASIALHRARGTWQRHVEAFIALTPFQKDLMSRGGVPSDRIEVKPNFFAGWPSVAQFSQRDPIVVFAGRLSEEKGAMDLLRAWVRIGHTDFRLRIIGDGPLRAMLERESQEQSSIEFLGQLDPERAQREIARARIVVIPSRCFETFSMVLGEAFAFGTPSLVASHGPLPDLVRPGAGATFRAGDVESLSLALKSMFEDEGRLREMSAEARRLFEQQYNGQSNYECLMKIYERAMQRAGRHADRNDR